MSKLVEYLRKHTERGACTCGACADSLTNPEKYQPTGHTSDVQFFKVSLKNNPDKNEFINLIKEHEGDFTNIDLFNGKEHSYIEIGAWIGDQGAALLLMGMGELLEVWELLTPNKVLPDATNEDKIALAQYGLVTIIFKK